MSRTRAAVPEVVRLAKELTKLDAYRDKLQKEMDVVNTQLQVTRTALTEASNATTLPQG